MVDITKIKLSTAIPLVFVLFIGFFFLISSRNEMVVFHFDDREEFLFAQSFQTPRIVSLSQSVSDISTKSDELLDKSSTIVFLINAQNPFDESAELYQVNILRNGKFVQGRSENIVLDSGEIASYETGNVPLEGDRDKKNTIEVELKFRSGNEELSRKYQYEYLLLTNCGADAECPSNFMCDFGNTAGLSNEAGRFFCAKVCQSNENCDEDQICKRGFCGY